MDGGFRASRPAERRAADRPEPIHRQLEERQAGDAPQAHMAASRQMSGRDKPFFKRFLWPTVALLIVILGAGGWFAWPHIGTAGGINSDKYQAVFFTNGQVYFGKLHTFNSGYMKLTDVYYLQSKQSPDRDSANPQAASTEQNNVQLIKLGDEIHGPEDEMIISKEQILFYENLKSNGKVAQSIEKFKDSR